MNNDRRWWRWWWWWYQSEQNAHIFLLLFSSPLFFSSSFSTWHIWLITLLAELNSWMCDAVIKWYRPTDRQADIRTKRRTGLLCFVWRLELAYEREQHTRIYSRAFAEDHILYVCSHRHITLCLCYSYSQLIYLLIMTLLSRL